MLPLQLIKEAILFTHEGRRQCFDEIETHILRDAVVLFDSDNGFEIDLSATTELSSKTNYGSTSSVEIKKRATEIKTKSIESLETAGKIYEEKYPKIVGAIVEEKL